MLNEFVANDEPILTAVDDTTVHVLSKEDRRRNMWRESSKKYYQKNKEKVIKRNLENYYKNRELEAKNILIYFMEYVNKKNISTIN